MVRELYKAVSLKVFGSPRVFKTLLKLTKVIARLKFKEVAVEEDAKETMQFYNVMLLGFQKNVVISQSPKDLAYQKKVWPYSRKLRNLQGLEWRN